MEHTESNTPEVERGLSGNLLALAGDQMPSRIFNTQKTDYTRPELFLGQPGGLLDTIHTPYPELMRLFMELKGMDWKHNEYDYSKCIPEFKTCKKNIYRMMIRTLAWQWEGDSSAARGIADILIPLCSCTETRVGYGRIVDNENLHAMTYSEITRGSFEDPSAILDEILTVRESHGRMVVVAKLMERARIASLQFQTDGIRTKELEQSLMLLICAVYMLERVQFMISFAVTFGICELKMFEPIGTAIQLIARDEYTNHVPFGEEVFKILMATDWGREAFIAVRPTLIAAMVELLHNEQSFVDYLHSDGDELPGVTPQKLKDWGLFNGRQACVVFDILPEVEAAMGVTFPEQLPLNYMRDWIDINEKQVSPQEQDSNQYSFNMVSTNIVSDKKINVGIVFDFKD